jgi:hypothetical protein
MAPNTLNPFGIPRDVFRRILQVATLEAGDKIRGAKSGTVASILNRYYSPSYGSNINTWLVPNQYKVMELPDFNRTNPLRAEAYYNSDIGRQELLKTGRQLGGATDFRSTKYLKDIGKLFTYPDNLIPTIIGGAREYLTPKELLKIGANPDYSENTFFNETKKSPLSVKWWEKFGDPTHQTTVPPTNPIYNITVQPFRGNNPPPEAAPSNTQTQVAAGNQFPESIINKYIDQNMRADFLNNLINPKEDSTNLFFQLLNQTRPDYS